MSDTVVYVRSIKRAQSTGVVTRSQQNICYEDCKTSNSKAIAKISDLEEEPANVMVDTLRKLERILIRQNEFLDETLTGMQATIDKVVTGHLAEFATFI